MPALSFALPAALLVTGCGVHRAQRRAAASASSSHTQAPRLQTDHLASRLSAAVALADGDNPGAEWPALLKNLPEHGIGPLVHRMAPDSPARLEVLKARST